MKMIDLTQFIEEDMPVYPGTPQPLLTPACTFQRDGFRETLLQMSSHTGTHMDAPSHLLPDGPSLDQLPAEQFFGLAYILDVTACIGREITMADLAPHQDKLALCQFALLKSGYDKLWGQPEYFRDYPVLSAEAARWLAGLPRLLGVGMDMISVDVEPTETYPNHHILLSAGKVVVENLTGLDQIEDELAMFSAFPLKYRGADGSPVRAVAFESPLS